MQPKIITSRFKNQGVPALGLTPLINIWIVTQLEHTLSIDQAAMTEVGDGYYKYYFSAYDPELNYIFTVDGGDTLSAVDRYQEGVNDHFADDTAHFVYEESRITHMSPGSIGEAFNQMYADVTQLRLDVTSVISLVDLLIKYEANRTRIDKTAMTLTVYDDDGTSVLQVFSLLDGTGAPSVTEVCERVPV